MLEHFEGLVTPKKKLKKQCIRINNNKHNKQYN